MFLTDYSKGQQMSLGVRGIEGNLRGQSARREAIGGNLAECASQEQFDLSSVHMLASLLQRSPDLLEKAGEGG